MSRTLQAIVVGYCFMAQTKASNVRTRNQRTLNQECIVPPVNPLTLHDRRRFEGKDEQFAGYHLGWYHKFYKDRLEPGSLPLESELVTTVPHDSDLNEPFNFVYWGYDRSDGTICTASAFYGNPQTARQQHHYVEGQYAAAIPAIQLKFVAPSSEDLDRIGPSKTLELSHQGDYVAYFSLFVDQYQHVLIDHLGYLAYLNKTQPPTTRFILVDVIPEDGGPSIQQQLLELIDPEFLNRVDWIKCTNSASNCSRMVQIRGGSKLKVVTPKASTRHADLLRLAREWISSLPLTQPNIADEPVQHGRMLYRDWVQNEFELRMPGKNSNSNIRKARRTQGQYIGSYQEWVDNEREKSSLSASNDYSKSSKSPRSQASSDILQHPGTIIFYTRKSSLVRNGRLMDESQEHEMIALIQHMLVRLGRTERLVIFDGTAPMREQIELFRSATVVIGPHGGGLANMLFMPSSPCHKPKVLEFVTSLDTPEVHNGGSYANNYYTIFSTCEWMEYHQLLFVPPSNSETTFVDIASFQDALLDIFGGVKDEHAIVAAP